MRAVAPKLEALKKQYGDDRMAMQQAMMQMYRDEKINPLGGCLPMLLQIPVFIGLYWAIFSSVELRQAPWLGWITDLSRIDPWFILPVLMALLMVPNHAQSSSHRPHASEDDEDYADSVLCHVLLLPCGLGVILMW